MTDRDTPRRDAPCRPVRGGRGTASARRARAAALFLGAAFSVLPLLPHAALAEVEQSKLSIDLNTLEPSDKGCRFTFVANNNLAGDLSKAAFEVVLFDAKGLVDRMTVLDFQELPAGHTRVRQFDIPGIECSGVSRILINAARSCTGEGVDANACMADLETASKSETDLAH